ncbi:hypothetical protein NPIL_423201 [Nephila pilipes]|uniref:Uncharacterized protein n=1 Tax=Nephila pilipes TaxID=299642 RepID=A0A8X6NAP9_NEPPI|nr:hypothetical protein NPIL_423201 [Nephila pilipes]
MYCIKRRFEMGKRGGSFETAQVCSSGLIFFACSTLSKTDDCAQKAKVPKMLDQTDYERMRPQGNRRITASPPSTRNNPQEINEEFIEYGFTPIRAVQLTNRRRSPPKDPTSGLPCHNIRPPSAEKYLHQPNQHMSTARGIRSERSHSAITILHHQVKISAITRCLEMQSHLTRDWHHQRTYRKSGMHQSDAKDTLPQDATNSQDRLKTNSTTKQKHFRNTLYVVLSSTDGASSIRISTNQRKAKTTPTDEQQIKTELIKVIRCYSRVPESAQGPINSPWTCIKIRGPCKASNDNILLSF